MHIPFVRMVRFKFLAHLPVDCFAHPIVSSFVFLLCWVAAFALLLLLLLLVVVVVVVVSKVRDLSRGWPKGSLFNRYYTEVQEKALLHSLDSSILSLILTLLCWMFSKAEPSTISWVFGMIRPGIESRSPRPLANRCYQFEPEWT